MSCVRRVRINNPDLERGMAVHRQQGGTAFVVKDAEPACSGGIWAACKA